MMASRRWGPTGWLRLVWGARCSVKTSRHAGQAAWAWRRVLVGWESPDHPRANSRRRRRRLSPSSSLAVGIGVGVHGGAAAGGGLAAKVNRAPKAATPAGAAA